MKAITFSHNPAVWIAQLGAVAVAVVNSGAFPALTDNAAVYSVLITAAVGAVTRFFVSPAKAADAPAAPPAA
jgi:hypothetical protein